MRAPIAYRTCSAGIVTQIGGTAAFILAAVAQVHVPNWLTQGAGGILVLQDSFEVT